MLKTRQTSRSTRATLSCGLNRSHGDCTKLLGLGLESGQAPRLNKLKCCDQFQPIAALIQLFFDDAHLRDKFRGRSGPATRAIVCSDACPRAQKLSTNDITRTGSRQRLAKPHDAERKLPRSFLHLFRQLRHALLREPDPLRNPHSAIRNLAASSPFVRQSPQSPETAHGWQDASSTPIGPAAPFHTM